MSRSNGLPENTNYEDRGCPGIPGCDINLGGNGSLNCPYEKCVKEARALAQRKVVAQR